MKSHDTEHSKMGPSILIVESHDAVRASFRTCVINHFPACRIAESKDGWKAICLTFIDHPAVVLLDFALPGIDGPGVTRHIKKVYPDTLVVMVVTFNKPHDHERAFAAGADICIGQTECDTIVSLLKERLAA